jgi:hypothetical protein
MEKINLDIDNPPIENHGYHSELENNCEWCQEKKEDLILKGEWCPNGKPEHGAEFLLGYMKGGEFVLTKPIRCLKCEDNNFEEDLKS